MKIKISQFATIKENIIKSNKKIIIYGAGMIGSVTTMALLEELKLLRHIAFFVDSDTDKIGKSISQIFIYSKESLKSVDADKYVLFIAISRFYDLLEELNTYKNLASIDCYIIPMLCIENFCNKNMNVPIQTAEPHISDGIASEKKEQIPKVIHYMWLGKKKLPTTLQKCVDSWKKYCPDYEIRCWNENNYDIERIPYMKQAYEAGAYGFVPDYARIDILYRYGGIYFDTDVELIKNIDELLNLNAFCGVEKWQTVNFGGGSGSTAGHKFLEKLLREREKIYFIDFLGKVNKNTCGYYDTLFFMKHGYKINGQMQEIDGVTVLPYDYFHPYDYMSGKIETTPNTYGIHHFNGGWLDDDMREANRATVENYDKIWKVS